MAFERMVSCAVALLFAVVASTGMPAASTAVLVTVRLGFDRSERARATTVTVCVSPVPRKLIEHDSVLAAGVNSVTGAQAPLAGRENPIDTTSRPGSDGPANAKLSVSVMPRAASGPLLRTVMT